MSSRSPGENRHKRTNLYSNGTFQKEFINLAIKAFVLVAIAWAGLYVFAIVEPYIGIKQLHVQITGTVATIVISFIIISAIRRLLQRTPSRIGLHLSASIYFFIALTISLITIITLMYQWGINPQSILIGGGVAAIIIGIAMSAIIGNMLSAGLMLTTFPAKIGDSIYIVNDQIRGRVEEINFIYTKILTAEGTEYVVPNNAIVQGNVRIIKDAPIQNTQLPYSEGDHLEVTSSSNSYCGVVSKVSTNFTTLYSKENKNEVILANSSILSGEFIIIKKITRSEESKNTKGNIAQ